MYSDHIPYPDEVPILAPPTVSFLNKHKGDGDGEHHLQGVAKQKTVTSREGSSQTRASEIPQEARTLFQDWDVRLFMLELFGLTSKVSDALGAAESVPYFSLFSAPTYLRHSSKKAYDRFRVMHDAIEVGKTADALFWAAKGSDTAGTATGSLGKTTAGVLQL